MSLLDLFRRKSSVVSTDAETLKRLRQLAQQELIVLSVSPAGKFTGDRKNGEEFRAWLDENAQWASKSELRLHQIEEQGRLLFPFFSSSEHLTAFINSDPEHAWTAWTTAKMPGTTLLFKYLAQAAALGAGAVLNPHSPEERRFSAADLLAARE